jgi:hypothetical protein
MRPDPISWWMSGSSRRSSVMVVLPVWPESSTMMSSAPAKSRNRAQASGKNRPAPRRVGGYQLPGRLGVGGMGQVYLGVSPGGRKVAVKLIH